MASRCPHDPRRHRQHDRRAPHRDPVYPLRLETDTPSNAGRSPDPGDPRERAGQAEHVAVPLQEVHRHRHRRRAVGDRRLLQLRAAGVGVRPAERVQAGAESRVPLEERRFRRGPNRLLKREEGVRVGPGPFLGFVLGLLLDGRSDDRRPVLATVPAAAQHHGSRQHDQNDRRGQTERSHRRAHRDLPGRCPPRQMTRS